MSDSFVKVTVYAKVTYRFCVSCARSNGRCECEMYAETGMHWDTCPGRIR